MFWNIFFSFNFLLVLVFFSTHNKSYWTSFNWPISFQHVYAYKFDIYRTFYM